MLKKIYHIGFCAYLVMLVLSLIFYKERTIFLDAAYNMFYIIGPGHFSITNFRFGNVLNQFPPLLAVKAGIPIAHVLQLYSAVFVVYYMAAYFVCGSILRRYDYALVILLLNILFAADTFYWMLSELPQAIAIFMILLAMVSNRQLKNINPSQWIIMVLALITMVFFHPLVLFVLVYALVFFLLSNFEVIDRNVAYVIASVYFTVMLVKFVAFKTPAEVHSMGGMKNFFTLFPDYFNTYANRNFLTGCITKYYWIPLVFFSVVVVYIKSGAWRRLVWFTGCFIGYLGLINISYHSSATPQFYIENLYLPLAVFLALPFVWDVLPILHRRKLAIPVFALILLTGCIRMYATHPVYTNRLAYDRTLLDKFGTKKVIAQATSQDTTALILVWGAPYECLLLAAVERNKTASIVLDDNPAQRIWAGTHKSAIVVNYNIIPYMDIDKRYFRFEDTSTIYAIIK